MGRVISENDQFGVFWLNTVRDRIFSSSTLKEASSWGKVDLTYEQMVFSEATLALPLITGYALHKQSAAARTGKNWAEILDKVSETISA